MDFMNDDAKVSYDLDSNQKTVLMVHITLAEYRHLVSDAALKNEWQSRAYSLEDRLRKLEEDLAADKAEA